MIRNYIYYYNTQAGAAQSGCCFADGKVPNGICCVKKICQEQMLLAAKSYFISLYA